jgi:putative Mg2+ transporter-C (MgtC) family protein
MITQAEITVLSRTLIAAMLGFVIGWERMAVGVPIRWRIITLTTMTSAAVTAVGVEMYATETSRIVAGILTGVGFLGAGVIMRSSTGEVRGQATAAALWAMSCIGIIVGTGHTILGVILTLSIYLILAWGEWPILTQLNQRRKKTEREGRAEPTNNSER